MLYEVITFNDLAMALAGHTKGGPAKVAVMSSGLLGSINGSAVANRNNFV